MRRMVRSLLPLLLLALGVGCSQPGDSADLQVLALGSCVSSFRGLGSVPSGIPRAYLARRVEVRLCDGTEGDLSVSGSEILLSTSPRLSTILRSVDKLKSNKLELPPRIGESNPELKAACESDRLPDSPHWYFESGTYVYLVGPTDAYRHGILGDEIEASGFCIVGDETDHAVRLRLGPDSVFEDRYVRPIDLTGDGQKELVVIRSYLDRGAALAVYRLVDGRIEHLAETPPIGIPNRWLNPAGAADFDGDGRVEIAYVETPHIGGTLRVWELVEGELRQEQAVGGFSNHAIGSRELKLSALLDWNADGVADLAVPANGRRRLRVVTFAGGAFAELDSFENDAEITTKILTTDLDSDGRPELLYGLEDGRLMLARP